MANGCLAGKRDADVAPAVQETAFGVWSAPASEAAPETCCSCGRFRCQRTGAVQRQQEEGGVAPAAGDSVGRKEGCLRGTKGSVLHEDVT